MKKSAEIAVITNLSANHLDIHKDMEEYIDAKKNLFLHQREENKLVLNFDNTYTRNYAKDAIGHVSFFSRQNAIADGIVLENNVICSRNRDNCRPILASSDILLPGEHNVENYMAAIAAVEGLVPDEMIRSFAKTFGGVEHRIEFVRQLRGVRYYNDSIGTSPTRTIAGLRAFPQKVILIAGGYDKHIPYDALGPELVAHVKAMVLTGATAPKIRAAAENTPDYDAQALPIYDIDDFEQAVKTAQKLAQEGDIVILSPASAAFDKFKNFMVRGARYKEIVLALE